jgi:hypothetical protein
MNNEQLLEHQKRITLGEEAKNLLNSKGWNDVVKPIIDSMVRGLTDIRDIKKSLLASNKKAEIVVEARATAAEYLENIEKLISEHISDGEVSRTLLEKQRDIEKPEVLELYRVEE